MTRPDPRWQALRTWLNRKKNALRDRYDDKSVGRYWALRETLWQMSDLVSRRRPRRPTRRAK